METNNKAKRKRNRLSAEMKTKIVLESFKEDKTLNQLASDHNLHPSQISQWRRQAMEMLPSLFSKPRESKAESRLETDLYEQIGRQKMELEWLKKKLKA